MSFKDIPLQKFVSMENNFLVWSDDGYYILNKNSEYFYQVQLQMYVTETKMCNFFVWSKFINNALFTETIHIDMDFLQINLA